MQKQSYFHWTTASNDDNMITSLFKAKMDFYQVNWYTGSLTIIMCCPWPASGVIWSPWECVLSGAMVWSSWWMCGFDILLLLHRGAGERSEHKQFLQIPVMCLTALKYNTTKQLSIWNDYSAKWKSKEQNIL